MRTGDNSSLTYSDPKFAAVPTYPVVLPFKLDDTDVNLFVERVKLPPIPGMPPANPNKTVRTYHSSKMASTHSLIGTRFPIDRDSKTTTSCKWCRLEVEDPIYRR